MKKSYKRALSLVVSLLLLIGLAACGGSAPADPAPAAPDAPAPAATEAPAAEAPAAEPAGDKVELTYAFWGGEPEIQTTSAALDQFNASQDRIVVTPNPIPWESYMTQLATMSAGGNLPDVGMMNEGGLIQWAEAGILRDVSDMYPAGEGPLKSLHYTFGGKTVGYASANEILVMYYNKDMFDAADVAYPPTTAEGAWSWDEFVAAAKQLTLDANGLTPGDAGFDKNSISQYGAMVENLTWQLEVWARSNGAGFYSADGQTMTINDPATIEAIQKVADLYLVDNVAPLSTGLTDDGVSRSLIAGTTAMTTNGTWNVGTSLAAARDEGLNYGIAVLPYMKDKVTLSTSGATVIFETTENPEEAMEFVRWYTSPDNNWSLIEQGIWMPTLEPYYTDETLTKKWLENPNFPPYADAKAVMVDYAMDYAVPTSWFYTNNTGDFNTLLGSVLGDVWTGAATADAAINGSADALQAAYEGMGL